jgi:hypothetical protein
MRARIVKSAVGVALALVVAGAVFALGRASVDRHAARDSGFRAGQSAGYFDGLRAGEARGRREGRTLQAEAATPTASRQSVRDAFTAGYAAGTNDAFAGYDGGWALSTPYLITLQAGGNGITYRIGSRDALLPNVNYYLCPNGHDLCQQPRR